MPGYQQTHTIPAADIGRAMTLTVHVSGLKRFYVRMQIGMWLMRLAGRVMGVGFRIVDDDDAD